MLNNSSDKEMNAKIEYESHFKLLKLIVNYINDLIPLIDDKNELSDSVNYSVRTIFDFVEKVVETLPNMFNAQGDPQVIKRELLVSIRKVNKCWSNSSVNIFEFEASWDEFNFWWYEFIRTYYHMEKLKKSIFVSLN